MIRIAFIYGAIAGAVAIAAIIAGFFLGADHGAGGMGLGYLIMIIALSMIFLGVKRHRDRNLGGMIKFGQALGMGLLIAAVAGIFYAIGWEAYLAATDYSFMPTYVDSIIESKREAGLSGDALAAEIAKLEQLKANYTNPLFRLPMTFIEIFPVGLVIALITAALLRNPKFLPARG